VDSYNEAGFKNGEASGQNWIIEVAISADQTLFQRILLFLQRYLETWTIYYTDTEIQSQ